MCIAQSEEGSYPCGETLYLEFHEVWGENHSGDKAKFQKRILLCNRHHSLVDGHKREFIKYQYQKSCLTEDVIKEQEKCGGYRGWIAKYGLDDSRFGVLLAEGFLVVDSCTEEEYYGHS